MILLFRVSRLHREGRRIIPGSRYLKQGSYGNFVTALFFDEYNVNFQILNCTKRYSLHRPDRALKPQELE